MTDKADWMDELYDEWLASTGSDGELIHAVSFSREAFRAGCKANKTFAFPMDKRSSNYRRFVGSLETSVAKKTTPQFAAEIDRLWNRIGVIENNHTDEITIKDGEIKFLKDLALGMAKRMDALEQKMRSEGIVLRRHEAAISAG